MDEFMIDRLMNSLRHNTEGWYHSEVRWPPSTCLNVCMWTLNWVCVAEAGKVSGNYFFRPLLSCLVSCLSERNVVALHQTLDVHGWDSGHTLNGTVSIRSARFTISYKIHLCLANLLWPTFVSFQLFCCGKCVFSFSKMKAFHLLLFS